jgi:hypothetical protein
MVDADCCTRSCSYHQHSMMLYRPPRDSHFLSEAVRESPCHSVEVSQATSMQRRLDAARSFHHSWAGCWYKPSAPHQFVLFTIVMRQASLDHCALHDTFVLTTVPCTCGDCDAHRNSEMLAGRIATSFVPLLHM